MCALFSFSQALKNRSFRLIGALSLVGIVMGHPCLFAAEEVGPGSAGLDSTQSTAVATPKKSTEKTTTQATATEDQSTNKPWSEISSRYSQPLTTPPVTELASSRPSNAQKWGQVVKSTSYSAASAAFSALFTMAGLQRLDAIPITAPTETFAMIMTTIITAGPLAYMAIRNFVNALYAFDNPYLNRFTEIKNQPRLLADEIRDMNKDERQVWWSRWSTENSSDAHRIKNLLNKQYIHGYYLSHLAALRSVQNTHVQSIPSTLDLALKTIGPEQAFVTNDYNRTPFELAMVVGNTDLAILIAKLQLRPYTQYADGVVQELPSTLLVALDILEQNLAQQQTTLTELASWAKNSSNFTGLDIAQVTEDERRNLRTLFSSIIAGADSTFIRNSFSGFSSLYYLTDKYAATALHIALAAGNYEVAQFMASVYNANGTYKPAYYSTVQERTSKVHKSDDDVSLYSLLSAQVQRSTNFAQAYIDQLQAFDTTAQRLSSIGDRWAPVQQQLQDVQQLIDENRKHIANYTDTCVSLLSKW